jgi:hypothetical protein
MPITRFSRSDLLDLSALQRETVLYLVPFTLCRLVIAPTRGLFCYPDDGMGCKRCGAYLERS